MPDTFTPAQRSTVMARVKGRDTQPEMAVRRLLHAMGYRFRLHRKDLPGSPDIVLPRYRKVIFVHGCFWHGHPGCARAARPTSNVDFWNRKLDQNRCRDAQALSQLDALGWDVLTIWQRQLRDTTALRKLLCEFMQGKGY